MPDIIVSYTESLFQQQAEEVSSLLHIPLVQLDKDKKNSSEADYSVNFSSSGLRFLSHIQKHGPIFCDFVSGSHRHRRNFGGGNGQMIAKAIGISGKFVPSVLDLTAGLGGDGFVLASLGCTLQLIERNPIVYLLLRDGLDRALVASQEDPKLAQIIQRINLLANESANYLDTLSESDYPDVIYLDPMFPARKKSAQVKKEMQALHQIVGSDDDASSVLERALTKAKYRIVVKRPAHSNYLGMIKPSYSLEGKSTRYDIFTIQKIPK